MKANQTTPNRRSMLDGIMKTRSSKHLRFLSLLCVAVTGLDRVYRGGYCGSLAWICRCAYRLYPDVSLGGLGFRAVLAPGQP